MTAAAERNRPTDHTRPLPPSVIGRCADTDSAHGITTGSTYEQARSAS